MRSAFSIIGLSTATFFGCVGLSSQAVAQAPAATCHLKDGAQVPTVSVVVKEAPQVIRTGDPIAVEWHVEGDVNLRCRTPLYLVLSTPNRTRFEGEKFLAFPPGAAGPYAIKYQLGKTRVFVPLHLGKSPVSGTVLIKVYKDGPVALDWALVEVPKLTADPKTAKDFAHGEERVGAVTRLAEGLSVISGNPAIVIRDHFPVEAPKKVIRSNSGEFDLQIFDKLYRVLDSKTGELLLERNGWDPNFSPSSRFLGAFADGPGFEIIDLYSGTVVTEEATLRRERGYRGSVHLAAWSPGDAIFALSIWGWGGIEVQQALVDGSHRSITDTSCHACQGVTTAFLLNIEGGYVAWATENFGDGWESLIDRSVGTVAIDAEASERIPRKADEAIEVVEQRDALKRTIADRELAKLASAGFLDSALPKLETSGPNKAIAWTLGSQLKLSHHCSRNAKGACNPHTGDEKAWKREEAQLAALTIVHSHQPSLRAVKLPPIAEMRLAQARGSPKGHAPRTKGASGDGDEQAWVWTVLDSQLKLNVNGESPLRPAVKTIAWEQAQDRPDRIVAPIVASIPSAAERFPLAKNPDDLIEVAGEYSGEEREATLIEPTRIRQLATFAIADRTYWLVQSHFPMGASSQNFLALVHGTKSGPSTMIDLASRLKFRVGSRPSGLNADGSLEWTEERATTMGFGSWPSGVDKVTVAFNRYLILSGHWLGANLRWVLLFDLKTDQILLFNRDVPAAATVDGFGVTEDGRTLVQLNVEGQLLFYDVATSNIILRGYHIDGELIVYDARGYYTASPEGSQFTFLKFPGLPGYNSLHQFARTLKRPDLIAAVLTGKQETQDPRLTPPASLSLAVDVVGGGTTRSATLRVAAKSAVGLEKLRIFVDGKRIGDYSLTGHRSTTDITIRLEPEAKWLAAVAIDKAGYESVAQGAALLGATKPVDSRLLAVTVGTDLYDDPTIERLSFAKSDALKFASILLNLKNKTYTSVEVAPHLDARGLRSVLPAKLREVAAAARTTDTIMLFVAGHGFLVRGQLYLATRETLLADVKQTAIGWHEIAAALDGTKARVLVLLDACHTGAAGIGTNDDAVSSLLKAEASITVLAAAKGGQRGLEDKRIGGGLFTNALVRAITTKRADTDSNRNGAIELAELYGAVKREVATVTSGAQTPWIARNLMVGEIPLF